MDRKKASSLFWISVLVLVGAVTLSAVPQKVSHPSASIVSGSGEIDTPSPVASSAPSVPSPTGTEQPTATVPPQPTATQAPPTPTATERPTETPIPPHWEVIDSWSGTAIGPLGSYTLTGKIRVVYSCTQGTDQIEFIFGTAFGAGYVCLTGSGEFDFTSSEVSVSVSGGQNDPWSAQLEEWVS